jgi:DNA-directed RNA polymerase sigma subunit (sigma70/sigma32)
VDTLKAFAMRMIFSSPSLSVLPLMKRLSELSEQPILAASSACVTLRELYEGLGQISEREQTYLLYRHGFTDDVGHTLIGTAIHFHLSESRAKKLEDEAMDNLWLELPWWF